MKKQRLSLAALGLIVSTLTGCATAPGGGSIYVPMGGVVTHERPANAPENEPMSRPEPDAGVVQTVPSAPDEPAQPSFQDRGDALSPASRSLLMKADQMINAGDIAGAIAQLERAQRISPRSAEVYFALADANSRAGQLGAAEQFALKGLNLAGRGTELQRTGWLMLADIRKARGNLAGADQARLRASQL